MSFPRRRFGALAVAALTLAPSVAVAGGGHGHGFGHGFGFGFGNRPTEPTTFAMIGDVPYGAEQVANFPYVIDQINADPDIEWTGHVGDIKSGSTACTDEYFEFVREQFDRFEEPLVYTPGDNEWTDCHRPNNGAYDPYDRLAEIRDTFFDRPSRTLGQEPMRVSSQWYLGLPENVTFRSGGATFAAVHAVGSNNGLAPWTDATGPNARQRFEVAYRTAVGNLLIRQAFNDAKRHRSEVVVLMMQADMFDPGSTSPTPDSVSGFRSIVQTIAKESKSFKGQVLLLDGDTHTFHEDQPLAAGSPWLDVYGVRKPVSNLTRITVEGSTDLDEYLKVTIDDGEITYERVPFDPTPVTGVKINEVESSGGDPGDWVELVNLAGSDLDISGFVIRDDDDTHEYTLPAGTTIPAGGYLAIDSDDLTGFDFGLGGSDSVRLYAPGGTVLLDSTTWDGHAERTWGRCPDGTGDFRDTGASTKGAANDCSVPVVETILINEIESSGGTPGDWVELVNTDDRDVDISGWSFLDDDDTHPAFVIPSGTIIAAGGYLVIDSGAPAGFDFGLGGGDSARLFRPDGTLADSYAWTAHADVTYGRCPDGSGQFAPTAASTKGTANSCSLPAVVFNEVESNGDATDWFELLNAGAAPVDLSGFTFLDNDDSKVPFVFPAGTVIAAGEFLVVENAPPGFDFGLGGGDSVRLFDQTGALYASYTWTEHATTTYGRCPDGTGDFATTLVGTKGAPNECGSPIVINEIESSGGEPDDWFELLNPIGVAVDVSGFTFSDDDDTHVYTFPSGTVIPPLGYLVVDTIGFGLGGSDSARLFDTTGDLVDSFTWTAHAAHTYGRCPDGSGEFADTVESTKGGQNRCAGIAFYDSWPGSADVATVDDAATFSGDMSGLAYEASGSATPGTVWAVENGNGLLYRLEWTGGIWAPAAGWETGKTLVYPDGTGTVDSEGVTLADNDGTQVYVGSERNNDASGVSHNSVLLFDTTGADSTIAATTEWDLTADLPVTGSNAGIEAMAWVSDSFLTTNGFIDEATGAAYDPSVYPGHGAGVFFVGVEATGGIYAYALMSDGTFARLATIESGFPAVMALEFDAELGTLWAVCDDTCQGRSSQLQIGAGAFTVVGNLERPAGMPNVNNEGLAIAPLTECAAGVRPVIWSDDNDTDGSSLRQGTVTCS